MTGSRQTVLATPCGMPGPRPDGMRQAVHQDDAGVGQAVAGLQAGVGHLVAGLAVGSVGHGARQELQSAAQGVGGRLAGVLGGAFA